MFPMQPLLQLPWAVRSLDRTMDTTALVRQIDACKQYILEQRKLRLTRKAVTRLRKDARSKANT